MKFNLSYVIDALDFNSALKRAHEILFLAEQDADSVSVKQVAEKSGQSFGDTKIIYVDEVNNPNTPLPEISPRLVEKYLGHVES